MIKALVFDCYGVLVTDGWLPFKSELFGHSPELMDQAGYLNNQYNVNNISYGEFVQQLSELSSMPSSQVTQAIDGNVSNKPLFKLMQELKKTYKVGMLSNIGSDVLESLFTDKELGLFDEMALSFETGFVKPDPRAYRAVSERLGVDLEECVMIDDVENNCVAAQDVGMQAVFYKDFAGFQKDLEKILANSKA